VEKGTGGVKIAPAFQVTAFRTRKQEFRAMSKNAAPSSFAGRAVRSRWVTIPLRLVGGIVMVVAASAVSQSLTQRFRTDPIQARTAQGLTANFAVALVVALTVMLAYVLFVRLTERRWASELQVQPALWELPSGIVIGLALSASAAAVIWLLGGYQISSVSDRSAWVYLIVRGLGPAVAVSVIEEILLRGLVLRILAEGIGRWWALAVSSLLFGALHMANPHASIFIALGLAIEAGFMLGVAFLWTNRLWLPIGIHLAWNFALSAIIGGAISGLPASAIIKAKLVGPDWISGGEFGIEGSLVSTIICTAAGCAILQLTLRNRGLVGPSRHDPDFAQSDLKSDLEKPADGPELA
jgi:membrane protease YdiL (CAAX protease family)